MSKITVSTKNIGGLKEFSADLSTGSVNVVLGKGASGKSSIIRGIHLGLTGSPEKPVLADEATSLKLVDTTSDEALLLRGSSEGSVSISLPDSEAITAVIPKSGMIRGTNTDEKCVLTTLLMALPPTKLHRSVFDADPDDPNNFVWVVDELSQAGEYNRWHQVLHSLEQEASSERDRYRKWKQALQGSASEQDEILKQMADLAKRQEERSKDLGAATKDLRVKMKSESNVYENNFKEFHRLRQELDDVKSANQQQERKSEAADRNLKLAKAKLDEAEDLLDMDLIEPDMAKYDSDVSAKEEAFRKAAGPIDDPLVKKVIELYLEKPDSVTWKELKDALNELASSVGDSKALDSVKRAYDEARAIRDKVLKDFMEKRRKYGMAEQQAQAARAEMASARAAKSQAEKSMTVDAGGIAKMEERVRSSEQKFKASEIAVKALQAEMASLDDSPEARKDEEERKSLESKLGSMETSTVFELRFSSLQMLPNQTMRLSEAQADELLGSEEDNTPREGLVTQFLGDSVPEIRSRLIDEIDNGLLRIVAATSRWAQEVADKQRQETRRIFNDVGTSLFQRLKVSPITSVSLDTDYQLRIDWPDGKSTGLTGSGSERTLIAAALLIAMRKAYTPKMPILMFDGVLENLDPRPREELLDFLSEYAKSESVAVVVSLFDSSKSKPTLAVR